MKPCQCNGPKFLLRIKCGMSRTLFLKQTGIHQPPSWLELCIKNKDAPWQFSEIPFSPRLLLQSCESVTQPWDGVDVMGMEGCVPSTPLTLVPLLSWLNLLELEEQHYPGEFHGNTYFCVLNESHNNKQIHIYSRVNNVVRDLLRTLFMTEDTSNLHLNFSRKISSVFNSLIFPSLF